MVNKVVWPTVSQHLVAYEDDAQVQRFFRHGFPDFEPLRSIHPEDYVDGFGTVVKEIEAYVNEDEGFTVWYVVREMNTGKMWLLHSANVRSAIPA